MHGYNVDVLQQHCPTGRVRHTVTTNVLPNTMYKTRNPYNKGFSRVHIFYIPEWGWFHLYVFSFLFSTLYRLLFVLVSCRIVYFSILYPVFIQRSFIVPFRQSNRVESRVNQDVIETFSVNAFMPLLGFHHQQSAWLQQGSEGSVWCLEIVRASFSCFNFFFISNQFKHIAFFRGREPG